MPLWGRQLTQLISQLRKKQQKKVKNTLASSVELCTQQQSTRKLRYVGGDSAVLQV